VEVDRDAAEARRPSGRRAAFRRHALLWGLPCKVELRVDVRAPGDNTLSFTVRCDSERALEDVTGFCLALDLGRAAAALGYRPSLTYYYPGGREFTMQVPERPASAVIEPDVPELRDRPKSGFAWHFPGGQALSARLDPPMKVTLERTMELRIWYVSGSKRAGAQSAAVTFDFPAGARLAPSLQEKMGPARPEDWPADTLLWDSSPVDLSFLNDRPAGCHGFLTVRGDDFVFEDGTPARFWGANLAAYALFSDKKQIERQAARIARLGFNLIRIHHHDSTSWVSPTVIDKSRPDSQHLDSEGLDRLDYLIYCLKREGVYVFLDLHVGRQFKSGDDIPGFSDLDDRGTGAAEGKGFCYYNERIRELMQQFNEAYLGHVNPYTRLAYKDDPAVVAVLVTNENDLTTHFGNAMLPDKNNPFHNAIFERRVRAFCERTGLPYEKTWRTWEPGPSKRYLNYEEAAWFAAMAAHLRSIGLKVPIVGTQFWAGMGMWDLPGLATMDFMDAHSYGDEEPYALGANPRYESNFVVRVAAAQVAGKPVTISEWHTPWPISWRAASPIYVAAVGALQGWDAPMLYNYSQDRFGPPSRPRTWTTYYDPAVMGVMPPAALAFRRGDFRRAERHVALKLDASQIYDGGLNDTNMRALRTLAEQHRLSIVLEKPPGGFHPDQTVTDPNRDFIFPGQDHVSSDTGEIYRNWKAGLLTLNSPRTQGAAGLIGYGDNGGLVSLDSVRLDIETPFAVVLVTSLDGAPIDASRSILITAVGRVEAPGNRLPFRAEPIAGTVAVKNSNPGMQLVPLGPGGERLAVVPLSRDAGWYRAALPSTPPTHWYLLTVPGTR